MQKEGIATIEQSLEYLIKFYASLPQRYDGYVREGVASQESIKEAAVTVILKEYGEKALPYLKTEYGRKDISENKREALNSAIIRIEGSPEDKVKLSIKKPEGYNRNSFCRRKISVGS